ncbi:MAG: RecX family transcriptional regulator [Candidatus Coatesbacteria bacterium]|nr:MAG: RecX family transcriptional regulator [Candidatus Coatesbacteria bacterium]
MPTITALAPQKRRPDRISVFVDGEFVLGLSARTARALDLYVGRELDAAEIESWGVAAEGDRAYDRALRYLRPRLRSRHEIEQRLRRYGYGRDVEQAVISRLAEAGYVDDRAFAEAWIRDRLRLRPKGRRALRAELAKKGVVSEDVAAALAEADEEAEEEVARRALAPRRELYRGRGEGPGRRAATAFLARRGFGVEVARRIVEEAFAAGSAEV